MVGARTERATIVKPRLIGPPDGDRLADAVRAINFYQEIGLRSGLAEPTMADELLERWGWTNVDEILEEAHDAGLIESGVSARTGWLTDKGRQLLQSLPEIDWSSESRRESRHHG